MLLWVVLLGAGCAVSKNFNPATKYAPEVLQQDYGVFKNLLEQEHPGLYWYTSKDSMDFYFAEGRSRLADSLTESSFRTVLSYVISKIRCGHTSVFPSKQWNRASDSLRLRPFPLLLKIWPDTAVITANLNRRDSLVTRGALLLSVEGVPIQQIVDSLFQYLPADGYNLSHKYQTLSNRGMFGAVYTAVYGNKRRYRVTYQDTLGTVHVGSVSLAPRDTSRKAPPPLITVTVSRHKRKRAELQGTRSLYFDSSLSLATMDLNSFTKDARLRHFFKRSFKKLQHHGTQNLIIDLRGNGGGSVSNSNLLTRYISPTRFKIADSLYTISRKSRLARYQQNRVWTRLFMHAVTRRSRDGRYHFRYYEGKEFRPKNRFHFNGDVYILSGGNTFSASTLFIQAVRAQDNVIVVGEETGGGAYGNNAWVIPDVTLPHTKVRFRLPLFRLVIDKDAVKGHGVMPEVPAGPTVPAIRSNADFKTEKVRELIRRKGATTVAKPLD